MNKNSAAGKIKLKQVNLSHESLTLILCLILKRQFYAKKNFAINLVNLSPKLLIQVAQWTMKFAINKLKLYFDNPDWGFSHVHL